MAKKSRSGFVNVLIMHYATYEVGLVANQARVIMRRPLDFGDNFLI